jgi:hypothetical protein
MSNNIKYKNNVKSLVSNKYKHEAYIIHAKKKIQKYIYTAINYKNINKNKKKNKNKYIE